MAEKFKIIQVTIKKQYYIPMVDDDTVDEDVGKLRTRINGWTIDEVIEDWFKRHDINLYHATRDSYHIGNSDTVEDIEALPTD